jgi:DNA-binding NarL/FixJ family response regulator
MLKLIIADNQAIFRAGIAKVLAVEDDIRIVAQAQTAEQMLTSLDKFRASVLICSATLHPDLRTVAETAARHRTRVVAIAEHVPYYSNYPIQDKQ